MPSLASPFRVSIARRPSRLLAGLAALIAANATIAAGPDTGEFGKNIQLAPFVVKGEKLSISVHARTAGDRRYATELAEDVVGIAYETMHKSTGAGLVIVGREGEPHPVIVIRKFLALAAAGQLDPVVAAHADAINAKMADWKNIMGLGDEEKDGDDDDKDHEKEFTITFDMIVPALPLPLEGVTSKLYQLSWAEGFDDARVEKKLRALTADDLAGDALSKYDWVFYLPPRNAYIGVQNTLMAGVMKKEKMGLMKRAAIKSALVVFKPAVKKAVEGFRKAMLYLTVLRARSGYHKGDIKYLTGAYIQVLMPDFKFNGGSERERALEAIEKQKVKNAEYWQDPFAAPARLATFDPAAYALFEGDYGVRLGKDGKPTKPSRVFSRNGDAYHWQANGRSKPRVYHPAGDRLFVAADGKATIEFKLDDQGAVTAVEERWERGRSTAQKKPEVKAPVEAAKKKK
jgi:hypothetical protein